MGGENLEYRNIRPYFRFFGGNLHSPLFNQGLAEKNNTRTDKLAAMVNPWLSIASHLQRLRGTRQHLAGDFRLYQSNFNLCSCLSEAKGEIKKNHRKERLILSNRGSCFAFDVGIDAQRSSSRAICALYRHHCGWVCRDSDYNILLG